MLRVGGKMKKTLLFKNSSAHAFCPEFDILGCGAIGGRDPARHAFLTLLVAAAVVSGCGGGSSPANPVDQPSVNTPPPALDTDTALSLYESAWLHASLTASALEHAAIDYGVWTTDYCVFGSGSMLASLDGGPVTTGALPAGSHTFAVTFSDCLVDGLVGTSLSGTASAEYTSVDLSDVTALVSTTSMRGTLLAFRSGLHDVTSDGSGTWRRVTTGAGLSTTTYVPTVGSRLVNNLTGNSATFAGGSYTNSQVTPPPGASASVEQDFDRLVVAINGTEYTLDGSLQSIYGFVGNQGTHTGEIRITSNGTLVSRVYGDANGLFSVEVLSALPPF
jgi:hypothetical protein